MTLLDDSVSLAMEAEDHFASDFQNTLSRASIISSVLYVEACANCCIDLLELSGRFADEVDHMSTAAKLDFFLHVRFRGRAIDRSRAEYQVYAELRRLRDAFVHPKAQKFDWIEWSETASTSTSPKFQASGLPRIPAFCSSKDAISALRATHAFMGHFFRDLCRMRPTHVSALLNSEDVIPNTKEAVIPYWTRPAKHWLSRNSIDLSYLRLRWL